MVRTRALLRGLDAGEAAVRAARIRVLLTDCDGVLTDGTVYCSEAGEDLLRFSRRDGMAVERLRAAGIECAIVTRERSPIVSRRAEKIGAKLHAGVRDKGAWLASFLAETGLDAGALAYMGDDVNDLVMLSAVGSKGLSAAPADAEPAATAVVQFVSSRPGGAGALREFADFIIDLRSLGPAGEEAKP